MVGMIAGGSGITPMYQILRTSLNDPEDTTKFCLIYANQTEDDILLRSELEDFRVRFPNRFWLHYTLDRPSPDWKYSSGFVDAPMLKNKMPPPNSNTIILACGPAPMIDFAIKPNLELLGYAKTDLAVF
jgi:cytochrome-b5 reductase